MRIHVVKLKEVGVDVPVVCLQCRERFCTECPTGALSIGGLSEIRIDEDPLDPVQVEAFDLGALILEALLRA